MMIKQRTPRFAVKNPVEMSYAKMHGHTKIELFDGLTGKLKERVEDDNMFTSAIPKMVNFALNHNYIQYRASGQGLALSKLLDNHLNLVGGLALIDTALDNDPDHFWLPSTAKLTACGSISKINGDANIPIMGSFNSSESTSDTLMRSWVWDFSTNQGNGTIATASLTSRYGGYVCVGGAPTIMSTSTLFDYSSFRGIIGLGNIVDRSRYGRDTDTDNAYNRGTTNGGYRDFCIDGDNDLKYMVKFKSDGIDILSHKMSPENFDIFRAVTSLQSATVESYSANLTSPYYWFFYNTDEKALYFWGWSNTQHYMTNNQSITINRLDLEAETVTMNYDSFTIPSQIQNVFFGSMCMTSGGAYMYAATNNSAIYKHTRGGGSGVSAITITGATSTSGPTAQGFVLNGTLYFGVGYQASNSGNIARTIAINLSDDSYRYIGCIFQIPTESGVGGARLVPPIDNEQVVFGTGQPMNLYLDSSNVWNLEMEHSSYVGKANTFTLTNYLATKNVLPQTVTKTQDKTMKVTYTITGEALS